MMETDMLKRRTVLRLLLPLTSSTSIYSLISAGTHTLSPAHTLAHAAHTRSSTRKEFFTDLHIASLTHN